jgi:lipopolysaccharide transport system permease protein
VYFLFAEIITRSPDLIRDNTNYVKKVVFPIELIPLVAVVASAFNFIISFVILGLFLVFFGGGITPSILLAPLIILPFLMFLAGLAWFTSAIGVYVKDVTYIAGFVSTAMMFLSPVFYAMDTVPDNFKNLMMLNPLTHFIEAFRSCVIGGLAPTTTFMLTGYTVGFGTFFFGYWFFNRVRGGFADVL